MGSRYEQTLQTGRSRRRRRPKLAQRRMLRQISQEVPVVQPQAPARPSVRFSRMLEVLAAVGAALAFSRSPAR